LGLPLVAFGVGYDRPWRMRTWDSFAVPRLYSRVRIIVGPRIWIPSDLDRQGIEYHRNCVEQTMNRLTAEAEDWAESGQRRKGQVLLKPQPIPTRRFSDESSDEDPGPPTLALRDDNRRCA
jgi:hypothetical protein